LVKQYKKLFDLDGVELEFAPGALAAIAKKALARKTGARGLRSIMEEIMLQLMYEIPSRTDIKRCIITQKVVEGLQEPEVIRSRKEEKKEETA
jgi:ATP-dependent Clp protease ATP-binding subunit ClpX